MLGQLNLLPIIGKQLVRTTLLAELACLSPAGCHGQKQETQFMLQA